MVIRPPACPRPQARLVARWSAPALATRPAACRPSRPPVRPSTPWHHNSYRNGSVVIDSPSCYAANMTRRSVQRVLHNRLFTSVLGNVVLCFLHCNKPRTHSGHRPPCRHRHHFRRCQRRHQSQAPLPPPPPSPPPPPPPRRCNRSRQCSGHSFR